MESFWVLDCSSIYTTLHVSYARLSMRLHAVRGYANDVKGYSMHSTRLWSRQTYRQDALDKILRYDKIRCHLITD